MISNQAAKKLQEEDKSSLAGLVNDFGKLDIQDKLEESKSQEIEEEIETECPICMTIMVEPTKLPCGHVFCVQCI